MARPENRLAGLAPLRGASGDSTRRHNLSTLLRIIHSDGAVSRSDLTKLSGLNRSTVLGLVAELIEIGAVLEHEPEVTRKVGRPSPVVSPATDLVAIAVNPDADAVTIAVVDFSGSVLSRVRHETKSPPTVAETVAIVTRAVEDLRGGLSSPHRVLGIGVALPGLVRTEDSLARIVPHLGWTDVALGPVLSQSTGLPVWADNDANLAVQAELTFGAGRGRTDIVYLNGGRGGIGGGVIVNGALLRGSGGYTGEFGHNAVPAAPPPTGSTAALSGDDLENLMSRQMLLDALGLASADERTFETALLTSDSAEVAAEVDRQLAILSVALRNAINVLNPELILLGGYLSALQARNPDLLDSLVRAQTMAASVESLSIERAALGADLLMIGAAELVFAPVLADPAGTLARQNQASPLY